MASVAPIVGGIVIIATECGRPTPSITSVPETDPLAALLIGLC